MITQPHDEHARLRAKQQADWSTTAPAWVQRRAALDAAQDWPPSSDPVNERLLECAHIAPGQHVLDLACGVGNPSFAIARAVGPDGAVLGLDVTAGMIAGAEAWAAEHQVANVTFRQIPSETELGVPDASYDAATCRCGLMFMPDPVGALQAIRRALKPGSYVAVTTWGQMDQVPLFNLPMTIIGRHVTLPPADPTQPGPTALPSEEALARLFAAAGLADFTHETMMVVPLQAPTPAEAWATLTGAFGPIVKLLASQDEMTRQEIRDDALQTLSAMFPDGPVALRCELHLAAGKRTADEH